MITVKEKLARGLNVFTRPQVVSLIIVTAVFLILFKESIQTTTIIVGFCSALVAAILSGKAGAQGDARHRRPRATLPMHHRLARGQSAGRL